MDRIRIDQLPEAGYVIAQLRSALLFEAYTNTLVGAQIMCLRATDMIGEMATAMANGLTAYQLQMAMRAYPTYGEAIAMAIADAMKEDGKEGQRGEL